MAKGVSTRPGRWVVARARERSLLVWLLIGVGWLIVGATVWAALDLRSAGLTAVLLLGLTGFARLIDRPMVHAGRWVRGARSEVAVGEELESLVRDGYTVLHDISQTGEGNIDHLVSGPSGVFLVETKHRRYLDQDLRKAKRQAAKLNFEVWVTPIICLDHGRKPPYSHQRVWIVRRTDVCKWISAQRNPVLPDERLDGFADGAS
jgi:hypothetical protein